jgi:DNA-binding LacI/PurR family transcriptional regulator
MIKIGNFKFLLEYLNVVIIRTHGEFMAKIKDIAQRAGVSLSAVSIAMNGKRGLSITTRERILKIAHELDYHSSRQEKYPGVIRFLKIALHGNTVNENHSIFINGYIDGMIEQAGKLKLSLEVAHYKGISVEQIVEKQSSLQPVQGVIILGTEFEQADFSALKNIKAPFVIIDNINDFLPYDFVNINNRGAVFKILHHFQRSGLTQIGLITSFAHTPNFQQREAAFRELVGQVGLAFDNRDTLSVNSTLEDAYQAMKHYLAAGKPLAQGYFCVNDIIACGCLKALKEYGLRIPEDISLIGFDDLPISAVIEPPLTTIQVFNKKLGAAAVDLLYQRISLGKSSSHTNILICGALIKRASVQIKSHGLPHQESLSGYSHPR